MTLLKCFIVTCSELFDLVSKECYVFKSSCKSLISIQFKVMDPGIVRLMLPKILGHDHFYSNFTYVSWTLTY